MGSTFADLLEQLLGIHDIAFSRDPERDEARLRNVESVLQTTLEKLRDKFDR